VTIRNPSDPSYSLALAPLGYGSGQLRAVSNRSDGRPRTYHHPKMTFDGPGFPIDPWYHEMGEELLALIRGNRAVSKSVLEALDNPPEFNGLTEVQQRALRAKMVAERIMEA